MTRFSGSDDLRQAEFVEADLRGARFVECDLSETLFRGVAMADAEIDSPWLFENQSLYVNGVDVMPFVESELNRRFPGRADRHAGEPDGLRAAWSRLERTWEATIARVAAMPDGTVDVSIDGEWSFAQTLRHLVHATDMWLGRAILRLDEPFHPIGQPDDDRSALDAGASAAASQVPAYAEVLDVRANRVAMVREFLATVSPETLAATRPNPHNAAYQETVLSCLHTILDEEWEHHRFAVRDLDAIESRT